MKSLVVNSVASLALLATFFYLALWVALLFKSKRNAIRERYRTLSGRQASPLLAISLGALSAALLYAFCEAAAGPKNQMTLPFGRWYLYLFTAWGGLALAGTLPLLGSVRALLMYGATMSAGYCLAFQQYGAYLAFFTTPVWLIPSFLTQLITKTEK